MWKRQLQIRGPNIVAEWHGISLAEFASFALPARVGRPVIDRTGLAGRFDIHLEYSRDLPMLGTGASDSPPNAGVPSLPPISVAIQRQLGLKLTSDDAPIKVIVIDRAERPSAN